MPRSPYRNVDIAKARALIEDGVLLLDLRDPCAYARGRIMLAQPVGEPDLLRLAATTPRETPILVYCDTGASAPQYAQALADYGFDAVYCLDGGFEAWRRSHH